MAYPRNELFQAHCAEQSLACGFEGQNSCRSEGIGHGMGQRHRQLNRRPHPRFPRASVRILENWLSEHCQSPYPTRSDQDWLKAKTGLKRSQIANWFANARKRGKVQSSLSSRSQPKETFQSLHVFSQIAKLHPFERWLNIGPEHEAAALLDIAAAVKRANDISNERLETISGTRRYRRGSSTNWQYFHKGSSVSSMEIRSYAANIKSVHSDEWKNEGEPSAALTKAAHRRRRPATQTRGGAMEETSRTMSRKFQCTFCIECFKTKHDWQRHEKSRHIPLETWTCSPRGSVNVDPITNEITCVFCGINDPDPEHIKAHGYTRCISRPASERIFSRKDHLRQHLRLMHGDCALIASIESWRNSLNVIRSRCGFCSAVFERWDARVNHLAEHFSDGALLSEWKGDWGFDPEVLKILELATLPGKVQQRSTTREVKSPSSLNDSNYALFLELERYLDLPALTSRRTQLTNNIIAPSSVLYYLSMIKPLLLTILSKNSHAKLHRNQRTCYRQLI